MKNTNIFQSLAILSSLSLLAACGDNEKVNTDSEDSLPTNVEAPAVPQEETELSMETADQKLSYAIGFQMAGQYMNDQILDLDKELFLKGINEAFEGSESAVSDADAQVASQEMQARHQAFQAAEAEKAQAGGVAFLAANKEKAGVVTTESGLQYEVLTKGDSDESPAATDRVKVHYHGTLIDGTIFDSSVDRGDPISFALNGVIKGWTEGLQLMTIGDKFRFTIPSDLGYGARDSGPIPAHSTLIFDVELLGINEE